MALQEDILGVLKDLERRIHALETTPQPPNIELSDDFEASFTTNAQATTVVTVTTTSDDGKRLHAMPNISLYKDSVTAANRFPGGSNWSADDRLSIALSTWLDWGETDNTNAVLKVFIGNFNVSNNYNLILKGNQRVMMQAQT